MYEEQIRLNYNRKAQIQTTQGTTPEHFAQVTQRDYTTGTTSYLLHKATLTRLGDVADLPNT